MESNKSTTTAVIIGVVVVLAGIGIFASTRNKDTKEVASTSTSTTVEKAKEETMKKPSANIVGLAVATPDLSTLVTAVKAASLVDTLSGAGPFTVFAPTNAAFAALPAGTVDTLLMPENKATLSGILTYHVVAGKVMAKDLSNGQIIKTVNGAELKVEIAGGKVMLIDAKGGKATVAKADIEASNGVVHVIDAVVLPQ
jgi:uncharacterized surface protein with fasciclin (FAS1) repeats